MDTSKSFYVEVTKNYLQSSSIRGFPRIIKAQNILSKLLWIVTITIFLGIAIWQVSDIVIIYLKYGVQLKYSSTMDPNAPFPSVTLCNQQPFAAEASSEGYIANRSFNEFVKKVNSLESSLGQSLESMKTVEVFYQNSQVLQVDAIAHMSGRLIKDCQFEFEQDGRLQTRSCSDQNVQKFPHPRYLRCFTVKIDQQLGAARLHSLRLVLFLDNFNYPFFSRTMLDNEPNLARQGVRVSVHQNGSLPQLEANYIDIPPGTSATLHVSTVTRNLLPAPYGDCKKEAVAPIAASSPLDDTLNYAYTPHACRRICLQELLIKKCGCLDPNLPVPRGVMVDDGAIDFGAALSVAKRNDPGPPPAGGFVFTEKVLPDGEFKVDREPRAAPGMGPAASTTPKKTPTTIVPPILLPPADGSMVPYCKKWPQKSENTTVANQVYQKRVACWQSQLVKQSGIKYCMLGARNLTCDVPCNTTEHSVTISYAAWPHESLHLAVFEKYLSTDYSRLKYFSEFPNLQEMVAEERYTEVYSALAASRKMKDNFVEIKITKPSWNVTVIAEIPSFPLSRLLSSIGGAMNLWSGITIIALLEFIELLAILIGTFMSNNCGGGGGSSRGRGGRTSNSKEKLSPADVLSEPPAKASESADTTGPDGKSNDTYGSLFTWS